MPLKNRHSSEAIDEVIENSMGEFPVGSGG